MIKKKDGFMGERMIVLPPMVVEMEENDPLVSSLYLTDIGYYPHASHHYCNRHDSIDQHVLIYCVDGKGWYRIGNREYKVKGNEYFILPAGIPHTYGAEEGSSWTIYWCHFRGGQAAYFSEGAQTPQPINVSMASRISDRNNIFEEMLNTLAGGFDIEHLRYSSSLLHHYLASMRFLAPYRAAAQPTSQEGQSLVEAAIHYMKENLEKRITLQDLLHYVGYSSSRFTAMFKAQTGHSPLNYFNQLKVRRACQLLRTTDMLVCQISCKLGFEDSLYFSRLFHKTVGLSPKQYREQRQA